MTRDEHRAQCIKAMAIAWLRTRGYKSIDGIPDWIMRQTIEEQTAVLDSLHGIARVNPIEATEEMRTASYDEEQREGMTAGSALVLWRAMSAVGDLTNPPEGKL